MILGSGRPKPCVARRVGVHLLWGLTALLAALLVPIGGEATSARDGTFRVNIPARNARRALPAFVVSG